MKPPSKSVVIDNIEGTNLSITETRYGRASRFGVRKTMSDGRWAPIGGTMATLELAYGRCADIVGGKLDAMVREAEINHGFRFPPTSKAA